MSRILLQLLLEAFGIPEATVFLGNEVLSRPRVYAISLMLSQPSRACPCDDGGRSPSGG